MKRTSFAVLLTLVACGQPADEPAEQPIYQTPPVVEPPPVADAPHARPLTADGWGPIRVGMTRAELVAAAGEDANPDAVGGPDPEQCDQFRPRAAPAGMLVMVERDTVTRISVGRTSQVKTDAGFGPGDAAQDIKAEYGARASATPHKYVEPPAEYVTVWQTNANASHARGIVYEIGADGRVTHVHAGSRSIQYVEGCL